MCLIVANAGTGIWCRLCVALLPAFVGFASEAVGGTDHVKSCARVDDLLGLRNV